MERRRRRERDNNDDDDEARYNFLPIPFVTKAFFSFLSFSSASKNEK
jgi:hypothetical protein